MQFIGIIVQVIALLLFATGAFAQNSQLSPTAVQNFKNQSNAIKARKAKFTEVQKKINTSIVLYLHEVVLKDTPPTLPTLRHGVSLNEANQISVDIKANVSDALIATIKAQGGSIVNAFPQYKAIRALIPITSVEKIAAHADVIFIDKAGGATTNKLTTSEGYVAHNVPVVYNKNYRGQGVSVGVLSDSVDNLAAVQATGDLGPVTVLEDLPGNSGEGTAMLEIVYDLAPSASLYFATAFTSAAGFANNIIALKNAGCKVIIDDVSYFNESPFQDDVISQAVSTVTSQGVAYFSSSANDGNKHSNTSGTYEADFVVGADNFHDFGGGVIGNLITENPGAINLFWTDPLAGSANDYDLYIVDGAGNIVDGSENWQTGTQDPYEIVGAGYVGIDYTGYFVAVHLYSGDPNRFMHLAAIRGQMTYNTAGATKGHPTIEAAYCVAATTALNRTTPFVGTEPVETFSSDGPRRVFYYPDGTPITPGNLSSTGGMVRQKVDITAADGVACSTPGFNPFYGTSAAAPHAGAIAATLFSARSSTTPAALRKALTTSALPNPAVWNDYRGYGIVMADRALAALGSVSPGALLLLLSN